MFNIIIDKKIERPAWLYSFDFEISKFVGNWINMIDNALLRKNYNYLTNVKGKMTEDIFLHDPHFRFVLLESIKKVQSISNYINKEYHIMDAWGIRNDYGDWTQQHRHGQADVSGIIYLNNSKQQLFFPDLDLPIEPKPGRIILWESQLWHEALPNTEKKAKYAIVFNLSFKRPTSSRI